MIAIITSDAAPRRVDSFADRVRTIRNSLHEVVVGQDEVIDQVLVCALPDRMPCWWACPVGQDADGQGLGRGLSVEIRAGSNSRPT